MRRQLSQAQAELQLARAELAAKAVETAQLGGRLAAHAQELSAAQAASSALREHAGVVSLARVRLSEGLRRCRINDECVCVY